MSSIVISSWIDMKDIIWYQQISGKFRPKYKVICNTCKKDRGYKLLQNCKKHPNCVACARKLDSPRVSSHWKEWNKNNPPWNKGKTGILSSETRKKIGRISKKR